MGRWVLEFHRKSTITKNVMLQNLNRVLFALNINKRNIEHAVKILKKYFYFLNLKLLIKQIVWTSAH